MTRRSRNRTARWPPSASPKSRADLLRYGWVADARVSRRLPDTLVIDLVERAPVAVLQERGRYTLIDDRGVRLPGVDPASVPGLPVLVASNPRAQMPRLLALLEAAPALKPQIAGATWNGNRRWDIIFRTGEKLALARGQRPRPRRARRIRADGRRQPLARARGHPFRSAQGRANGLPPRPPKAISAISA